MTARAISLRRPSHPIATASAVFLVCALLAAPLTVSAQTTASIPLATLGVGPQSGTASNGVAWTVNVGSWIVPQGYVVLPAQGPQVWTFDRAVSLRFGVAGLNITGECIQMPAGIVAEFIHPNHNWNPATGLICRTVDIPGNESTFTLAGPVTTLVLGIIGQAAGGRGPTFIQLTTPPAVAISPLSLPGAVACAPFSQTLTATGGWGGPYTFAITAGALPGGLTLSPAGVLSGTPAAGAYSFTVTATDNAGVTGDQIYSGTVAAAPAIIITPSSLPTMTVGTAFSQALTATGGSSTLSFSLSAGALPAGVGINPATGTISGTPTVAGSFTFMVTVTDGCASGARTYTVTVAPAPSGPPFVGPTTLPAIVACTPFSQTLTATGGQPPYAFALSAGALPAGLTFNTSTATISGTPSAAGPFSFTITATDSVPQSGNTVYAGSVGAPATLSLTPAALPAMIVDAPFSQVLTASGAPGPYTFAVTAGALPAGLTLNAGSGQLSGTPTTPGSFSFTVTVTGAACASGTAAFAGSVVMPVPSMPIIVLIALAGLLVFVAMTRQRFATASPQ